MSRVSQIERDIENWETIKKFLTIYLAEIAIPEYRNNKQWKYINAMTGFSNQELINAKATLACWGDFHALANAYN